MDASSKTLTNGGVELNPSDNSKREVEARSLWFGPAILLGSFILVFVMFLWFLRENTYNSQMKGLVTNAEVLKESIRLRLDGNRDYLLMIAKERGDGAMNARSFQERASSYVAEHPEMICINWVDASYLITDVAPIAPNRQIVGLRLDLPEPMRASRLAVEKRQPVYTHPFVGIQGELAFELWVPVFRDDVFLGLFGGIYSYEKMLRSLVSLQLLKSNSVSLVDSSGKALLQLSLTGELDEKLVHQISISPPENGVILRFTGYGLGQSGWALRLLGFFCLALVLAMAYAMCGLKREIAVRKRAVEQLRLANHYNRSLIEASLDPLVTIDPDGRITDVNSATEKITGCSREKLVNKDFSDYFTEPDKARAVYQLVFSDGTVQDFPLQIRHQDGHTTSVMYNATVFRNQNGELKGVFAAARDITAQKKLEIQLLQAQKMEAIGTLAGGIAHDFNNILTAIIGFSSLLEMKMAEDDPLHENVKQILAAADRAANLTRSMLAFSRKQIMEVKPVNLNQIIDGIEKMLRRLIREDIELRVRLTEDDLIVMADAGQIEQVLLNLATNARDSMPSGGAITISTERTELDETFKNTHGYGEPGSYALISFADSGVGMDERTRQRIFEPFFTTKELGKGTGLGLAVCYGIIKQHNGYIICYSEPGRGTTFRIYLSSCKSSALDYVNINAGYVPPTGGTETILVAEDDSAVRLITTSILTEFGYTIIEAQNGDEAVARFFEQPDDIHLCLFDMIMPKKNGRDAYAEIKKIRPGPKVLFMSGYQADMSKQDGLFLKGAELITKPVLPMELLRRVREILDR